MPTTGTGDVDGHAEAFSRSARLAGPVVSGVVALVWLGLAANRPDATYHFAPLLCAAAWGAARRVVARAPGSWRAGVVAGVGGMVVALTAAGGLVWWGALDGPARWGTGGA